MTLEQVPQMVPRHFLFVKIEQRGNFNCQTYFDIDILSMKKIKLIYK